jgi:hypothetical protein
MWCFMNTKNRSELLLLECWCQCQVQRAKGEIWQTVLLGLHVLGFVLFLRLRWLRLYL